VVGIFGIPFIKSKKEKEFELIYRQYYPVVYRQLYYLLASNSSAEDIAQEVFIKLYNSKSSIEHPGAWLSRVAANTALNYIRSEGSRQQRADSIIDDFEAIMSAEDEVCKNEQIQDVRRILAQLPASQRTCLLLKFSGYSYDDISSVTGIPKSSVGQMILRGKKKFMELYSKEGDIYEVL